MDLTVINPSTVHPATNYSHAVRMGDLIFVSGQVAMTPSGELVGQGDVRAQTEQVFENLRRVLEASGATFADVVKIQTFLTTLDGIEESREVRARYLPSEPPASTAVHVVALLLPDALIEVELTAVVSA